MLDQVVDQGTVVGSYRIEGVLGRGGMGTVFRARHQDSGRVVALKVMAARPDVDPALGQRLRAEGRAQAALEHPNVVTVYEAGESEHGPYIAMRLIDGPTLVELVRERRLGARDAVELLVQVAGALDAAHAVGLVHRDVKPHNVLVGEGDHAYLADFGLTRAGEQTAVTASGALVGTAAYLAPEVVRGGEATPASDRYAFAAMTFECLTGTPVFPRPTNTAVLFAQANDPPPRIGTRRPGLGDDLDALFEQALSKEPSERPGCASDFVAAVRGALERSGAIELPPPPPPGAEALHASTTDEPLAPVPARVAPVPRRPTRAALLVALGVLAGAAAVAVAWAVLGSGDETQVPVAPADRAGLVYVGADLNGGPTRTLDCRGRAAASASPACTVTQAALPGATVVVPRDGLIRQWSVRGARGDVTLAVLRPREGGLFQVALSDTETAGSAEVQTFRSAVDVEAGDRVGVVVGPASAVGVRPGVAGARIDRWIPPVPGTGRPPDRRGGSGFDSELLVRVGIAPGAAQKSPPRVAGAAAERLPAGEALARTRVKLGTRSVRLALVDAAGRTALDAFAGDRRTARIGIGEMRPGAAITRFYAQPWSPEATGVDVSFVNEGSARLIQRSYVLDASGLTLIR
jgi:Protein kinase domain